ncbi:MAG: signal peptide peptidase SppA [Candidatus Thorarchaeota archaeon]
MPIPRPRKGESNKALKKEYPDEKQRHAICQDSWRKGPRQEACNNFNNIMDLLDGGCWALTEEALDSMHQILAFRLSKKAAAQEFEFKIGEDKERPNAPYMEGSTAVIPIMGPIVKKANLFTRISGGTSAELLERDIKDAISDDDVKSIALLIDSPGGSVDGPFDVADVVMECRGKKPIMAYADGQMTSAAYLIGSAADKVYAAKTARVGSIGVIMAHYDYSKAQEMRGVKKTYLYSGKYKAMGHDSEPLTDEARKYLQGHLDDYYTMFVDMVAVQRGVDTKTVLDKMADGKVFIGKKAIDAELIDGISTFKGALTYLSDGKTTKKEVKGMPKTIDEFRTESPDQYKTLVAQIMEQAMAECQPELDKKDKEIDALKKENESLSQDLGKTNERLLKLEKQDAIRSEKEMAREADAIWSRELADSDVPPRLHKKAQSMVSHEKFVKDEVLDREAFTEAVRSEITDWEDRTKEPVIGGGTPPGAQLNEDEILETEDDEAVQEMLEMAEGEQATQH